MRKLREIDYRARLQSCKKALGEIRVLPRNKRSKEIMPNWKAAVARWASRDGPQIAQNFVTKAVNEGELKEPAWLSSTPGK
jgi:hypothetical protein